MNPYLGAGLVSLNPLAALGGLSSGVLGWLGQKDANETNVQIARETTAASQAMAREQMGFQAQMSNTAYQRSRADMEKAGLNPMLMASQGGASTPQGASGNATSAHVENALGGVVSSARDTLATLASVDKMRADTRVSDTQAMVNEVIKDKVVQETKTSGATAKNLEQQTRYNQSNAKLTENNQWRSDKINEGLNNVLNLVDRMTGGGSSSAKRVQDNPYRMDRYLPRSNKSVEPRSGMKER